MGFVDWFKDKIKTKKNKKNLTKEISDGSMMSGVRNPFFESVSNGLTPERLGAVLLGVDQNDPLEYLALAQEMKSGIFIILLSWLHAGLPLQG